MAYRHQSGMVTLTGPRVKSLILGDNEALALLDAHRQAYRMAFNSGDYELATIESDLHGELLTAVGDKRRWGK